MFRWRFECVRRWSVVSRCAHRDATQTEQTHRLRQRIQRFTMWVPRCLHLFSLALLTCLLWSAPGRAQQVSGTPGQFDYYLLNLSWSPEFCHNVEVLPLSERSEKRQSNAAVECGTPHGFVLHGMWPQNFSGTWPANCSAQPGPASYTPYLQDTPSLTLLQHEWSKHGTCSGLAPDAFFTTADKVFESVKVPAAAYRDTPDHPVKAGRHSRRVLQGESVVPAGQPGAFLRTQLSHRDRSVPEQEWSAAHCLPEPEDVRCHRDQGGTGERCATVGDCWQDAAAYQAPCFMPHQ